MNALRTADILDSIVPITRFNKGEANKIFSEVNKTGVKIVVKNNTPECVLISPKDYQKMVDEYEDALLFADSEKRLAKNNPQDDVPFEKVLKENGITQSDLDSIEDVVLE